MSGRLTGIKGARGTGKTTMLLQHLASLKMPVSRAAYFSLDELYFTTHSLVETAKTFYQQGGKVLALDEVHKYPRWAAEIKNLYDRYKDLQIIFTGSSILDISRQEGDLSRRALMHELKGLSFREYLGFFHHQTLPSITLAELLSPDFNLRAKFPKDFKPLVHFGDYLQHGYYPFSLSDTESYHQRLQQLTRLVVEYDMAELKGFDIRHAKKMLQLLYVVAQQVPFKPNLQSLAEKTNIHRNSINNYLHFLHEARLLHLLYPKGISVAVLQKPEKIYLDNPNLLYALSESVPSTGTVRETFFNNQLSVNHRVNNSEKTDFIIDGKLHFEIGGKTKGKKQVASLPDAWVVKDDLEYPVYQSLPLWAFGFLY
ncbi:MAG: AAA family ATPase [Bacteroidota bacterium]|nr:AAA family ATPase [Bacteroidota bacterium]